MNEKHVPTALELMTFQLADQGYALDIMSVREIRGWTKTTPLPHAPDYMKGVINLRGTVLPVMDLSLCLGLSPQEQSGRNVIIVVEYYGLLTGLMVDAVSDIVTLTTEDLQKPPDIQSEGNKNVVSALTLIEDRMIRVLNLGAVIQRPQSSVA